MVGMVMGGVNAQLNEFYDLIKLLSDRENTLAMVKQLKDASDEHEDKIRVAREAEAAASASATAASIREKELDDREASLVRAHEIHERKAHELSSLEADLATAHSAVAQEREQLARDRATHEALASAQRATLAQDVDAHNDDMARENATLDKWATEVTQREDALKSAEADYAKRMAVLKQLTA